MENTVFQRIQRSLLQKRHNLSVWLSSTPEQKKQIQLGELDDRAVQTHLAVLDTAIEKAADHTLGVCQVCHDRVETSLLEMDYTSCICLDHFSEQERRQLEAELEFSQIVQQALMPQQVPAIPGLDLAVFGRPAQIVAGDYFDFFQLDGGVHGLAIADAMGHGVSASMLMTSLQTALRTLVPEIDSPAEVLKRINRLFLHNANFTTFVTAVLARFDPVTRTLTYCNAGHNPPLLFCPKTNRVSWLQPTGAAIGLIEQYMLRAETITLDVGDVLVLYTDGVTEATNPLREPFGNDRLSALITGNAHLSVQELLHAIRQGLNDFIGPAPLQDDITLVVIKASS